MNRTTKIAVKVASWSTALIIAFFSTATMFASEQNGEARIVRQNTIDNTHFVYLTTRDDNMGSVYQIDEYACGFVVYEDMFSDIDTMTVTADDHIIWHAVEYGTQFECRANNITIDTSNQTQATYTYTLNTNIATSDFITRFADDIVESNATSVTITTNEQEHMFILTYNAVTMQTPYVPADVVEYTLFLPVVSN